MSIPLEDKIMAKIGLAQYPNQCEGSRSCGYLRQRALQQLSEALEREGLTLDPEWQKYCEEASRVDNFMSQDEILRNTWTACSNAIRDAIERKNNNGKGYRVPDPTNADNWQFETKEQKQQWAQHQQVHKERSRYFGHHFESFRHE